MKTNDKINFYLEKKITVHIETKDKKFYNGVILEYGDKHIIFIDRYLGEMFIYLNDIVILEPYKEKEE